jgi:hypothetical protein
LSHNNLTETTKKQLKQKYKNIVHL